MKKEHPGCSFPDFLLLIITFYTKNIKFSDKFLFIFSTFQLLFASVQ